MKLQQLAVFLLILLVGIFISCSSSEDPKCEVSISEISAEPMGGTYSVMVSANTEWTMTTSERWISLSETKGSGNAQVNINVSTNNSKDIRCGDVTLKSSLGNVNIHINQDTPDYIDLSLDNITVGWEGCESMIKLTSNKECQLTTDAEWITLKKNVTRSIVNENWIAVVATNKEFENRTGIIYIKNGEENRKIKVTQDMFVPVNSITLSCSMGTTISNDTKLNAKILPENYSAKELIWSSSDTNVLTVDSEGCISPQNNGKATITVKDIYSNVCGSIDIYVKLLIEKIILLGNNGESIKWNYLCGYPGAVAIPKYTYSPYNAKNDVFIVSSNPNVVKVENGKLYFQKQEGTSTIEFTSKASGVSTSVFVDNKDLYSSTGFSSINQTSSNFYFKAGGRIYTEKRNAEIELNSISLIDHNSVVIAASYLSKTHIYTYNNNTNCVGFETSQLDFVKLYGWSVWDYHVQEPLVKKWYYKIHCYIDGVEKDIKLPFDVSNWAMEPQQKLSLTTDWIQ